MSAFPYARLITALAGALVLAACGQGPVSVQPTEIASGTACALDGMILQDFPGPKAQIHYEQGETEFFCDTKEMFSMVLRPEQRKRVVAVYTQDMGKADWTRPQGHWLDAKAAFYVVGGKREGSMGPTIGSFGNEEDARSFAGQYGGKVVRFEQVTLDMADLTGGAAHDKTM